jgi:hypothetical protein
MTQSGTSQAAVKHQFCLRTVTSTTDPVDLLHKGAACSSGIKTSYEITQFGIYKASETKHASLRYSLRVAHSPSVQKCCFEITINSVLVWL